VGLSLFQFKYVILKTIYEVLSPISLILFSELTGRYFCYLICTMASNYKTKIVSTSVELENIIKLRVEVFVLEQFVPAIEEIDALDTLQAIKSGRVIHVMVSESQLAVGTARLVLEGSKPGSGKIPDLPHIGRVAVKKTTRRKGIGEILMVELQQLARTMGFRGVTLSAQSQAAPFYTQLGYSARGPVYDDVGIPHQDMDLFFD
jgi:predicted GNAT family N-acyltransferase